MASVRSKAPEGGSRSNSPDRSSRLGGGQSLRQSCFGKRATGTFSSCGTRFVPPSQSPRPLLPRSRRFCAQGPSSCSAFLALLISVLNGSEGFNLTGQKARMVGSRSDGTDFGKRATGTFSSCGTRFVPPSQSTRPLLPQSRRFSAQGPSSFSAFLALLISVLNGSEGKRAARLARPGGVFGFLPFLRNFPCDQRSSGRACLGSQFDVISNGVAA
jgi:hypothetical protein